MLACASFLYWVAYMGCGFENIMKDKVGVVFGIANNRSIATGIARALVNNGARVIVTYQNDVLKSRVESVAEELGINEIMECDVAKSESIKHVFEKLSHIIPTVDFMVHAIAFSDKNELSGRYVDTSLENFLNAMHISCFSFTEVARHCSAMMPNGGSMLTLTYYGAEKFVPNYNVMGICKAGLEASVKYIAHDLGVNNIRVNAISAGPVKTLASSGIHKFNQLLNFSGVNSPLRRNVTTDEIGNAAMYLLSDLSAGVTAEIMHVDCGYNSVGVPVGADNTI